MGKIDRVCGDGDLLFDPQAGIRMELDMSNPTEFMQRVRRNTASRQLLEMGLQRHILGLPAKAHEVVEASRIYASASERLRLIASEKLVSSDRGKNILSKD